MGHICADRICETSTSTGTGDLALAGALIGYQSFSNWCSDGDDFYYLIEAVDTVGAPTGQWETGLGKWDGTANALVRTYPTDGSTGGGEDFTAGTKRIYLAVNASMLRLKHTMAYLSTTISSTNFSTGVMVVWDNVGYTGNYGIWSAGDPTKLIYPADPAAVGLPSIAVVDIECQVDLSGVTTGNSASLELFWAGANSTGQPGSGYAYGAASGNSIILKARLSQRQIGPGDYYQAKVTTPSNTSGVSVNINRSWFQMKIRGPYF